MRDGQGSGRVVRDFLILRAAWLSPLLGVALTLSFAPFDLKPLAPLSLAALFWLARDAGWRRAAWLGWLYGVGQAASGVYWVYISTHVYGGAPSWLGALLAGSLFVYLGFYPAAVMGLAARLRALNQPVAYLALPALWVLGEMLLARVLLGFPWFGLGYVALDTPFQSLAAITGVHGISALIVLLAVVLALGAQRPRHLLGLLVLLPLALSPHADHWTQPSGAPLSTAIVQGNIAQDQKWLREMQIPTLLRYRDLTVSALGTQLIVWPEVALTQRYDEVRDNMLAFLDRAARDQNSVVLAGLIVADEAQAGVYNSIVTLGAAQGRYDKHHLVPFGEFFPIPDWLRPIMDVLGTPYSDFLFGDPAAPSQLIHGQRIGMSICFEDVFGDEFRRLAQHSSLLVNATNDAWFGRSEAAEQHLGIARMRAIETARVIIRASNTGRSAIIGPDGELQASAGFFTTELLSGSAQPRTGQTPYVRWGDAPLAGLSGLLALGLAVRRTLKSRRA